MIISIVTAHLLQVAAQLVRGHTEASEAPWGALRCLVGDVAYGGRVADQRDQRVLAAYLGRLFCAAAAAPGAALAPAPGYSMPDAATLDAVKVRRRQGTSGCPHVPGRQAAWHAPLHERIESLKPQLTWQLYRTTDFHVGEQAHIAAMPLRDAPEVLGQHANADAAVHALEATALLSGLAAMQRGPPAVVADGAGSEARLLATAARLVEQAQHFMLSLKSYDIKGMHGWSNRAVHAQPGQRLLLSSAQQHEWHVSIGQHFAAQHGHDQPGAQVPDARELDAALAAAAAPRAGDSLLQAVLAQELERHASLAARVRRDTSALERMLGGRAANSSGLADCASALLAGQARRKQHRHFIFQEAGIFAMAPFPAQLSAPKKACWTGMLETGRCIPCSTCAPLCIEAFTW